MSRKKLLCVDDDPATLMLLEGLLKPHFTIAMARDGQKAISFLESEEFDLVITDLQMPYVDGFSLMENIVRAKSNTPVIVLTKYSDIESVRKSWKLGAFDLVEKPVDRERLFQSIKLALEYKSGWLSEGNTKSLLTKRVTFGARKPLNGEVWHNFVKECSHKESLGVQQIQNHFEKKYKAVLDNFDPENRYTDFLFHLKELRIVCGEIGAEILREVCEEIINSIANEEVITQADLNVIKAKSIIVTAWITHNKGINIFKPESQSPLEEE